MQQVTAAFLRMRDMVVSRTVTVDGKPSFDRMYSIPGDVGFVPPPGATIAYVGRVSGALTPGQPDGSTVPGPGGQGTMPELCDGVYLLDGFDTSPSLHIPIMLHELAHLSGGMGPNSMILDQVFASEAAFEAQTTQQRLINVQCYEFYATELLLGTGLCGVSVREDDGVDDARAVLPGRRAFLRCRPPSWRRPIRWRFRRALPDRGKGTASGWVARACTIGPTASTQPRETRTR